MKRRPPPSVDPGFVEFVAARSAALFRTAVLIVGDRHAAEDLVQGALERAYRHWDRVARMEAPEAYRRLQVTGRAADLDLLKTFGEPGILQFRPVVPVPTQTPSQDSPTQYCQVTLRKTGINYRACGRDGAMNAWVTDPVGISYSVVAARAVSFSHGGSGDSWGVMVTLDATGTEELAAFTARTAYHGKTTALMVDGAVSDTQNLPPITDGKLGLAAGSTAAQARLLAEILATQGPMDLVDATMTVSTR